MDFLGTGKVVVDTTSIAQMTVPQKSGIFCIWDSYLEALTRKLILPMPQSQIAIVKAICSPPGEAHLSDIPY
jgi:hypothetical protein